MVSSTLEESCKHDRKWLCNLIQKHHHITRSEEEQQNGDFLRRKRATNIHNIPVVLQQLSIPYPSDADYIDTIEYTVPSDGTVIKAGVPFPTIMTVDMVLLETHSPREFANFDLKAYRQGLLDNF